MGRHSKTKTPDTRCLVFDKIFDSIPFLADLTGDVTDQSGIRYEQKLFLFPTLGFSDKTPLNKAPPPASLTGLPKRSRPSGRPG